MKQLSLLKELREDKDLKQKDIARDLNITQRNYSYYETSQTILNEDILQRLANYYNTSIDYILYRTDVRKPYPKSIVEDEKEEVGV